MNIALWVIACVAAVFYAAGGASLTFLTKEKYRSLAASQHWADDFGPGHLKAIGVTKMLGALGLVLPAAVGIAPVLVPLAACGLMLVMAGAATTRFRRSEWAYMAGDVLYLGVFAFLAWGRFALHPFA